MATRLKVAVAAVVVGFILTGRVQAEPLVVQQGGFSFEGDPFGWGLAGQGFSIGGGGSIPIISPGGGCGGPCPPGKAINLSSVVGNLRPGSLSNGSATIFGHTYDSILLGGALFFDAPFIALPEPPPGVGEDSPIFITRRFSFTGLVFGHEQNEFSMPGAQLFEASFVGEGNVRLRALWLPEANEYFFREVTYEFAPVPEPATMFLVGVGGVLFGRNRRRTFKRRHVRS